MKKILKIHKLLKIKAQNHKITTSTMKNKMQNINFNYDLDEINQLNNSEEITAPTIDLSINQLQLNEIDNLNSEVYANINIVGIVLHAFMLNEKHHQV